MDSINSSVEPIVEFAKENKNTLLGLGGLGGKVALVTGASSGMGLEIAKALGKKGCSVGLCARSVEKLEGVAMEIRSNGGFSKAFPVDCSDGKQVESMASQFIAAFGVPDFIIHCAGAGEWKFIDETSDEEFEAMLGAPLKAAFYVTRAFLPQMQTRGSGTVLFVNSPACLAPWPASVGYATARAGLKGLVAALSHDTRGTGVRICHAIIGETTTGYFATNNVGDDRKPTLGKLLPKVTAEGVANAVVHALETGRRELVYPFALRLTMWQNWLFPTFTAWSLTFPVKNGAWRV